MKTTFLNKNRILSILLVLVGCIAVNAITGNPFNYRTDGIAHIGFPLTFYEVGGFSYREIFRLDALAIDLLVVFAVTAICFPAIECRLRPKTNFSLRFPLSTLLLCASMVAILLGLDQLNDSTDRILLLYGPFIALGLAYLVSIPLGQETRASSFALLILSFAGVYFGINIAHRTITDSVLILFHLWTLPLWVIWFVAVVDIDQFLPDIHRETKETESDN